MSYESSGHSAVIAQIQRQININNIARAMGPVYKDGSLLFATQDSPTPFAKSLIAVSKDDIPHQSGQSPVVAELGSGNGRDALYFVRNGYRVIAYELNPAARARALSRFRGLRLEERLIQREDFHDVADCPDHSLDLVHAVSSLHYFNPTQLLDILKLYTKRIKPNGKIGIALKTPQSSWPTEFHENGRRPDITYDLSNLNVLLDGEHPIVIGYQFPIDSTKDGRSWHVLNRMFYNEGQLRALLRMAGYAIIHSQTVPVSDYDRQGKTEHFAWVVGTPLSNKVDKI